MSGTRIALRFAVAALIVSGAATLLYSGASAGPKCSAQAAIASNFNGTPIEGGNYIWFNANLSAASIPRTGATVYFSNSTIQFTADQPYNLSVPNAQITFDPTVNCATTSFDPSTNTFSSTVPVSGSDEIFLTGLAFPVPDSFANVNGKITGPVVWQGTLGANATNLSVSWKWGAAVYTTFTSDYNALEILPTHGNSCAFGGGDHAGTPEGLAPSGISYKRFVIGGARGGGGSNWTGSWSGTQTVPISNCH
jgi:hypothetical protein